MGESWNIVLAVVCNVTCALLGCFLVLRRLSLIGDAISHGVLPGIVLAFLWTKQLSGVPMLLGAMLLGFLTAWLTQALASSGKVSEDAGMGIVFTGLFALGVLLVTHLADRAHLDVDCILYGKLVMAYLNTSPLFGVDMPLSMRGAGLALLLTLVFLFVFWKELKITSFDPALATSMGFSALMMHYLLMSLVGAVTVASFEAVGSILVIAMLIVPAACAQLWTDRLVTMLLVAAAIAAAASVGGYRAADLLDVTAAGMMAVATGLILFVSVLFAPRHGVLSKKWRNWRLRLRIIGEDVLGRLYRVEEQQQAGLKVGEVVTLAPGLTGRLAVKGLRRQGWVESREGLLALTEEGRKRAVSLVRAHRLWEAYPDENLALPRDHLHEAAHRMEHFLDPELQQELAREVKQPDVDPHGRSIPPSP